MIRYARGGARLGILFVALAIAFSPFASVTWAQTPIAEETPTVIVEPETPVATETETPVATETPTEPPVQNETPTETVPPTDPPQEPTTPPIVTVPDQLTLDSSTELSIGAGEYRDITIRYTLGSDRSSTEIGATIESVSGDSLAGWTIAPVGRVDLADDPADPGRDVSARVDVADATAQGGVLVVTFRVTAPAHVEQATSLNVDVTSSINTAGSLTAAVNAQDLVSIHAAASVHAPTLDCAAGEANSWTCSYATTHPGSIAMSASATVADGWQLTLDGTALSADAIALSTDASGSGSFVLQATYPIGCPDVNAASATLAVAFSYPSGEVRTLVADLALAFDRPDPTMDVTDLSFGDIQSMSDLTSSGTMTVSYANVPCAWMVTFDLSDLTSDAYTVTNGVLSLGGVEGLPGATASIEGNTLTVHAPEATSGLTDGEFTISLTLTLPHIIPPGNYVIGVITQLGWLDN